MKLLEPILDFLSCETPKAWVHAALANRPLLLIDHAHCEKKAASTALNLLYRYVQHAELLQAMSRLAREELRHFERVLVFLEKEAVAYQHLSPSRYMSSLGRLVRHSEPERLVDTLILGALVEARSTERFATLIPHLEGELQAFYQFLLKSEARHYQTYLALAEKYSHEPIEERIACFQEAEAELITSPDPLFRFHSGVPS